MPATHATRRARYSPAARVAAPVLLLAFAGAAAAPSVRAAAPTPGDWYLTQDRVTAAQAELPAAVTPVRVALIDSGIDGTHPALSGSIVAARSFVPGSPLVDENGHGTFVAGEVVAIGAATATATRPSPIQLVVAKVVESDGTIAAGVEAAAIRWAVDEGARVINLSLGGLRDPGNLARDTYSPQEAAAVRSAIAHRAVVVAAVGNGDAAPSEPWPYASWPAALPHVIGVSAISPDGSVPVWSDRDPVFNELAAPGADIVSTFPRPLTALVASCPDQGYSDCGPSEYQPATGTSFAAPQISAAAALLLAAEPQLTPDQVSYLLERSADDANPGTGCAICTYGRDAATGWGTLDIGRAVAALSGQLPPANPLEPTNDAGNQAAALPEEHAAVSGDLDYWENPLDVYRLHLARGQQLWARLSAQTGGTLFALWRPGTVHLQLDAAAVDGGRIAETSTPLPLKRLHYRARRTGWYYLEVALRAKTNSPYTLSYTAGP